MRPKMLLAGASVLTLAAGTASAQTGPNTMMATCPEGNVCKFFQGYGSERNTGLISATGTANEAEVVMAGDDNRLSIAIRGDSNRTQGYARGDAGRSSIEIAGDRNYVTHSMDGARNDGTVRALGKSGVVHLWQHGEAQSASLTQLGSFNILKVAQDAYFPENWGGHNRAQVHQDGSNLQAEVWQREITAADFIAPTSDNQANIRQVGSGSVGIVRQVNRGNTAWVWLFGGGVDSDNDPNNGTPANFSEILQENRRYTADAQGQFSEGAPSAANNPLTGNLADVSVAGQQNSSSVRQNGVLNQVVVSMIGGGAGVTQATVGPSGTRRILGGPAQGNRSSIGQLGRNLFAEVSIGGLGGAGNRANIQQGGERAPDGVTWLPGRDHKALLWQRGQYDMVDIYQYDNRLGGADGQALQAGSLADVSQISFNSRASITQYGTNSATVTQGRYGDSSGGDLYISIEQRDTGDAIAAGVVQARKNVVDVSQYGIKNDVHVAQKAVNADAQVWQKRDSAGSWARISQGLRYDAPEALKTARSTDLAATIHQDGKAALATINQDGDGQSAQLYQASTAASIGTWDVQAEIRQYGGFNSATVAQTGTLLNATVKQHGTGTETMRHAVSIAQSGDRHSATVTQTADVRVSDAAAPAAGAAGVPFARAAGSHSAEVVILQSGSVGGSASKGNTAQVEQRGAGQYARIEQNGRGNSAAILRRRRRPTPSRSSSRPATTTPI